MFGNIDASYAERGKAVSETVGKPVQGRRQKSVSVESAWSPSTISFSPHEVNLLK
jgi:hypothetical protein